MISSQNLKTITDMRKDADGLLRLAKKRSEPIGILKNNKLEGYLIDTKTLEALEQLVEDYLDTKIVEERLVNAKPGDFIEMDGYLKVEGNSKK